MFLPKFDFFGFSRIHELIGAIYNPFTFENHLMRKKSIRQHYNTMKWKSFIEKFVHSTNKELIWLTIKSIKTKSEFCCAIFENRRFGLPNYWLQKNQTIGLYPLQYSSRCNKPPSFWRFRYFEISYFHRCVSGIIEILHHFFVKSVLKKNQLKTINLQFPFPELSFFPSNWLGLFFFGKYKPGDY